MDFEEQSIIIKKLYYKFRPKAVVVDANGLGIGLTDTLKKRTINPTDGQVFQSFDHVNWKERMTNDPTALKVLYPLKAQGINDKIIATFMVAMNGMVELLKEADFNAMHLTKDIFRCKELCYVHTDMLIEEINKLQTVETGVSKELTVDCSISLFNSSSGISISLSKGTKSLFSSLF